MVKATDVVCKYNEDEFAVKHKKDGFKADSVEVSIGYQNISLKTRRKTEVRIILGRHNKFKSKTYFIYHNKAM